MLVLGEDCIAAEHRIAMTLNSGDRSVADVLLSKESKWQDPKAGAPRHDLVRSSAPIAPSMVKTESNSMP